MHIITSPAGAAETTGNLWVDNDGIADGNVIYSRTDGVDPTSILMTEDIGKDYTGFLAELSFDNVQISTTHTSATNAHYNIVRGANLWLGDLFDHRMLSIMVQTYGFHVAVLL